MPDNCTESHSVAYKSGECSLSLSYHTSEIKQQTIWWNTEHIISSRMGCLIDWTRSSYSMFRLYKFTFDWHTLIYVMYQYKTKQSTLSLQWHQY